MKFCKNINAVLVAALAAFMAFFAGCSSDSDVAGNSAETGSPELAGILVLDNGKPAARTKVQCVPSGYNILAASKAEQVLPSAFETVTDENGNYEFDSIPSGNFSLEAFHEESGKRLLVQNIEVSEGDSIAVSDTLREPGIVKFEGVKMDSNGVTGIATVLGTTIRREFIVHEQALVVDSLPAGKLDLQVFFGEYSGEKPWANLNVDVVAGDTETILLTRQIGPEIEILHHDSVTLTFVAPLALPEGNDSLNSVMTDIPVALRLTENNCNFDSLKSVDNGRWEAVRISKGGSRSNKLPINYASFDRKLKELVIWVRVDSLNVCDSLEIVYEGLLDPLYALDVFPTNRSYSLVWHFDSGMAAVSDGAEKGYFEGLPTGDAPADGVVGEGIKLDEGDVVVVENSAIADSSRKVNLNYDGSEYFCFSVWVQLESLDKEQKIFEKEKEYELRYDPAKGFVVNLWVPDTVNYLYSWASGTSGIKAGEWVYVAFSRHTTSQVIFYLNKTKIESEPERIAWGGARDLKDFKVGGFAGKIDELMLGSCFRDDDWTRLTYLNQKPTDYWPVLQVLK